MQIPIRASVSTSCCPNIDCTIRNSIHECTYTKPLLPRERFPESYINHVCLRRTNVVSSSMFSTLQASWAPSDHIHEWESLVPTRNTISNVNSSLVDRYTMVSSHAERRISFHFVTIPLLVATVWLSLIRRGLAFLTKVNPWMSRSLTLWRHRER